MAATEPSLFDGLDPLDLGTCVLSTCNECPSDVKRAVCEDPVHRPWRYELRRVWDQTLPALCWVMLNPSTATARADDPTIRRCVGFAKSWSYGGIVVVNLYSLRATDPRELARHRDPIGPDNDAHLTRLFAERPTVVCAWGSNVMVSGRAAAVLNLLAEAKVQPSCLGRTKLGRPKHPLYVRGDTALVEYGIGSG